MLYITDSNKDPKRDWMVEYGDPEMLSQLGPVRWVLELQERDDLPAWQDFLKTGKADADGVAKMLDECSKIEGNAGIGYANALKLAVPPIFVAED